MTPYINSFRILLTELEDRLWIWKCDKCVDPIVLEDMIRLHARLKEYAKNLPDRFP